MIIINSPKFIQLLEKVYGGRSVNAASFWPFIVTKYKDHTKNREWINHEKIHLKQQVELLLVGFVFWYTADIIYRVLFLRMKIFKAYKANPFEREAYLNQKNDSYLYTRKHFAFVKYIDRL